uniref:Uncharacterized protein n=1 Tax=Acrobeloides nanus TaxID=290746 RepID=A0A914DEY0_9BILA
MSDHNQNPSSDDSWQKLAISYNEFDVLVTDINEEELVDIGHDNKFEHLSAGSFSSPAFPVNGIIHGLNIRYMVPLVCQLAGKPNSQAINVWFLVDTNSPFTCLTMKSLEAFFGQGNATRGLYSFAIQFVNILGADAMRKLELSIVVDWKKERFQLVNQ